MSRVRRILVVGAGPAGLAAAISARRYGIDADVIEIRPSHDLLGSELGLIGPALRALDEIEAADSCVARGVPIPTTTMSAADGTVLSEFPNARVARSSLPPMIGISRSALNDVLLNAAVDAGSNVRFGTSVASIVSEDDATVTFSDGSVDHYDLVVAADGAYSSTRRAFFPELPAPHYVGQQCWRARVPRRGGPFHGVYFHESGKAGLVTVSQQWSYIFLLRNAPDERIDPELFPGVLRELLEPFTGGLIGASRDELGPPSSIHLSPLNTMLVPAPWSRGRVLLIGDAAHATTPHLTFGAGLSIEDGVVLGAVLRDAVDIDSALEAFVERRFDRCRMVVENGWQLSAWEQSHDPDADHAGLTVATHAALARPM